MELVNRTFSRWELKSSSSHTFVCQTALAIKFDGNCWNFKYRSSIVRVHCCLYCSFHQPELEQFGVELGKLAPADSPSRAGNLLLNILNREQRIDLVMLTRFGINEDGTRGELKFASPEDFSVDPLVFKSNIKITRGDSGQARLHIDGEVGRGLVHEYFEERLLESQVSIEEAFSSPVVPYCMGVGFLFFHFPQLIVEAVDDESLEEGDYEDYLGDFWNMVSE